MTMSKGLFITGTGTDIGKTYVTGLLMKKLAENGYNCAYFKAAMSGNDRRDDGSLIPGEALHVKTVSGISQPLDEMCPYIYETAVSPHLASKTEGSPVDMDVVKKSYDRLAEKYEYIITEGSGGIMCPLRYDDEKLFLEDLIHTLKVPSIIIADAGLGTINSVVLTVEYMRAHDLEVKGVIFNNFHNSNIMEEDNKKMCEELTGIPVIACIGENSKIIDIDAGYLASLFSQEG